MNNAHPKHRKNFFELFPPPKFLEMPTVGFDISDEAVRFAELKRVGNHNELGIFGSKPIPKDIIEEGYIKDKEGFIKILAAMQREHNLQFVSVSLPEEKSYLFRTTIPVMDEGDIRSALQFKIEENVPVALKDAVYDFRILRHAAPGDTDMEVSVTVIHRKVVESYLEVFQQANLVPVQFLVESQAMARVLITRQSTAAYIIVGLRESKTILAIIVDGEVQFTSTIPIGSRSIVESIQRNFAVNAEEAEQIRQGKELKASSEMFLSLTNASSALRDHIQKLFTYWDTHGEETGKRRAIERILVAGADAMLGLDEYLARSLDVPVSIANPWKNILSFDDDVPQLTRRESLDYVAALGLALPYDI